jgi:hypothetical protein
VVTQNRKIEIKNGDIYHDYGSVDMIKFDVMADKQPYKEIVIDGKIPASIWNLPVTEVTVSKMTAAEFGNNNTSIQIFRYKNSSADVYGFIEELSKFPNLVYAELVACQKPIQFPFDLLMGKLFNKWLVEGPVIVSAKREIDTQYIYKFLRK